jgi:ubiquitin-like 1-activating enzyme E1 A
MRDTKILLIGFKSLSAEVCKNLVLAGVQSVTILESETVTYPDLGAHIFLTAEAVGQNV